MTTRTTREGTNSTEASPVTQNYSVQKCSTGSELLFVVDDGTTMLTMFTSSANGKFVVATDDLKDGAK